MATTECNWKITPAIKALAMNWFLCVVEEGRVMSGAVIVFCRDEFMIEFSRNAFVFYFDTLSSQLSNLCTRRRHSQLLLRES